jgi:hypothetical protein
MRKKTTQTRHMATPRGGRTSDRGASAPQAAVITGRARGRGEAGE